MSIHVKLFDEEHEVDLEEKVNAFLGKLDEYQFIDVKYQVSTLYDYKTQIYCYSAMVVYKDKKED
jgi:hypothetical protein